MPSKFLIAGIEPDHLRWLSGDVTASKFGLKDVVNRQLEFGAVHFENRLVLELSVLQ